MPVMPWLPAQRCLAALLADLFIPTTPSCCRPVFFYIDPEFATDPKMNGINIITLRWAAPQQINTLKRRRCPPFCWCLRGGQLWGGRAPFKTDQHRGHM